MENKKENINTNNGNLSDVSYSLADKLNKETKLGLIACRNALIKSNNNYEKAITYLKDKYNHCYFIKL